MIEWYVPLLAWAAVFGATARGVQVLLGDRGPRWLATSCGMLAWIPVHGLPIARWLHGYNSSLSIPLIAILLNAALSPLLSRPWLDEKALRAGLWWGVVAGVFLYPMAAGLGPFDPYVLGWRGMGIEVLVAGLSVILLWWGNAFGWVFILTGVAWRLGYLESDNIWDYLIDPVYFAISLVGLMMSRHHRSRGNDSGVSVEFNAGSAAPRP